MLFCCAYTWNPTTHRDHVWSRVLAHEAAGTPPAVQVQGWYSVVGGGSGFLLVETDDLDALNAFLHPYHDLMSWDVRPVQALNVGESIQQMRETLAQQH